MSGLRLTTAALALGAALTVAAPAMAQDMPPPPPADRYDSGDTATAPDGTRAFGLEPYFAIRGGWEQFDAERNDAGITGNNRRNELNGSLVEGLVGFNIGGVLQHRGHHLARVQEVQVQGAGDDGVEQEGLVRPHRVLVLAEQRQAVLHEVPQRGQGVAARHGQVEGLQPPGAIGELARHHLQHLGGDGVRLEAAQRGDGRRALAAEARTVLGVEVPAAAGGVAVGFQQDAEPAAHGAVEGFHHHARMLAGELGEVGSGAQEVPVLDDLHGGSHLAQCLAHPPVTRLQHADALGA